VFFNSLTIRGEGGALLWTKDVHASAAALAAWAIRRDERPKYGPWVLTASCRSINRFRCGQRPLFFTAPRLGGGRWCFPVLDIQVTPPSLTARLGSPEQ
jgi:hypothetical protein